MITIHLGEKQPVPCEKCGFMGYAISDHIKTHYTTTFKNNGDFDSGFYSDYQPYINKAKTPHCAECGSKLGFKVDRTRKDEVIECKIEQKREY